MYPGIRKVGQNKNIFKISFTILRTATGVKSAYKYLTLLVNPLEADGFPHLAFN